jgi:predicted TIM-barrel fold metal-dependent hydrolase
MKRNLMAGTDLEVSEITFGAGTAAGLMVSSSPQSLPGFADSHTPSGRNTSVTTAMDREDPALASIRGIPVLDVDTHLSEPADLWTSRAPKKYLDLVPRVETRKTADLQHVLGKWSGLEEAAVWVVEEDIVLGFAGGSSVINKDNIKVRGSGFVYWPLSDLSPAASFVPPRLDMMDEVGIWGQIVYPNAVGFGGQNFASIADPELRMLCLTIWNDAMAEMQEESGNRLFGMGVIPWWDTDLAVKEIGRIHDMGLKGVNTNADPQNQGMPDLADSFYQPMWEACDALNLPVNFHNGASVTQRSYMGTSPWPSLDKNRSIAIGSMMIFMGNARVLANLIFSGVLDRNPGLKFVSVESGIGWIPFTLDALDYQMNEQDVDLSMKPSEYFERQLFSCFWFESGDTLLDNIERLGADHCMFETDFPHPTCLYPQPLAGIAQTVESVDRETRKILLGGAAAKVYNIELPKSGTEAAARGY